MQLSAYFCIDGELQTSLHIESTTYLYSILMTSGVSLRVLGPLVEMVLIGLLNAGPPVVVGTLTTEVFLFCIA